MIPQLLSTAHLIIILVVVLVLFGGTRLAGLGKASGQAIREFKEEISGDGADKTGTPAAEPPAVTPAPDAQPSNQA